MTSSLPWGNDNLGKVMTLQRGYDLPSRLRKPGVVPIVSSSGISDFHAVALVQAPGVVTGRYGTIGQTFYLEEDFWPLNTTLFVSNFHGNDPKFCYYILKTIDFASHSGKSGVPGINRNDIHEIALSVPTEISEQQAIAEALGDADALIEGLEALIVKKRNIKQGAMQELLTSRRRLPGFQGPWQEVNLAKLSHLKARIGWQGLTTEEYLSSGDYYLVTGTDFVAGRVDWERCCFVERERFVQDPNIQIKPGDILLTKDGTIGKVGFVDDLPGPATLNSGIFVIRPKNAGYEPLFVYYVLCSSVFDAFLNRLQAGSTIVHLYQKDVADFQFKAPDADEQRAIAAVLSDMDAEIAAAEEKLAKARAVKQGMMQVLLTGEIGLI